GGVGIASMIRKGRRPRLLRGRKVALTRHYSPPPSPPDAEERPSVHHRPEDRRERRDTLSRNRAEDRRQLGARCAAAPPPSRSSINRFPASAFGSEASAPRPVAHLSAKSTFIDPPLEIAMMG